ncbi:MAG: GYD domain-containing protein [SAR202 cluster bacterium]|nr:GYD domain-containing protein [SAR202 cluster bacterium]
MPLYFLLGTLTYEGQRMLHNNPNLVIDTVREVRIPGATILSQYAVLGKYDFVMLAEADDNEAVGLLSLEIGVRAGLHTETLPAIAIGIHSEGEPSEFRGETEFAEAPTGSSGPEEWRLPRPGSPGDRPND